MKCENCKDEVIKLLKKRIHIIIQNFYLKYENGNQAKKIIEIYGGAKFHCKTNEYNKTISDNKEYFKTFFFSTKKLFTILKKNILTFLCNLGNFYYLVYNKKMNTKLTNVINIEIYLNKWKHIKIYLSFIIFS